MSNDLEQLMKQLQNHEEEKQKNRGDDRLIGFKPGNTYTFRLIFIPSKSGKRFTPWIHNRTHNYTDPKTGEYKYEICPSSEYIMDGRGYNMCPGCKKASAYHEEFKKTKSKSAEELFKLYGSVFNGFVPVVVVNDPVKPENNGKVKIMRYGKTIKNYFLKKILGRDEKGKPIAGYNALGSKAFDINNGYNFIITVTKPNEWNNYETEFSNELTSINIDKTILDKMCESLRFEEDFMRDYDEQKLHIFFQNYLKLDETEDKIDPTTNKQDKVPHYSSTPSNTSGSHNNDTTPTMSPSPTSNPQGVTSDNEIDELLKGINS